MRVYIIKLPPETLPSSRQFGLRQCDLQTHIRTHRHINTMPRLGVGAGLSEKFAEPCTQVFKVYKK